MLDPRVYRAAFVPALLAVFVVAFSLEGRPRPATTRLAADAFDGARAYGGVRARNSLLELGGAFPAAPPGQHGRRGARRPRRGHAAAATASASRRRQDRGRTVDGTTALETVEGVRPGRSGRRIVVLAHRDALASPGLAELSGTAALLELARIFRSRDTAERALPGERRLIGRDLRKTLVLVSTSGGSAGAAGARAWAARAGPGHDRRGARARRRRLGARAPAVGGAVVERRRRVRRWAGSGRSRRPCARRSASSRAARGRRGSGRAARCR